MFSLNATHSYTHLPNDLVWNTLVGSDGQASLHVYQTYPSASTPGYIQEITLGRANPYTWVRSRDYGGSWGSWRRTANNTNWFGDMFEVKDANQFKDHDITAFCTTGTNCPNIGINTEWKLSWSGNLQIATNIQYNLIYSRLYKNNSFNNWESVNMVGGNGNIPEKQFYQISIPANTRINYTLNKPALIIITSTNDLTTMVLDMAFNTTEHSLNTVYSDDINISGHENNQRFYENKRTWNSLLTVIGGVINSYNFVDLE